MTARAFVLIEAETGKRQDVATNARGLPNVEVVDILLGPYDVVVLVGGLDVQTVGDLVATQIHEISGVRRTMTCFSLDQT